MLVLFQSTVVTALSLFLHFPLALLPVRGRGGPWGKKGEREGKRERGRERGREGEREGERKEERRDEREGVKEDIAVIPGHSFSYLFTCNSMKGWFEQKL